MVVMSLLQSLMSGSLLEHKLFENDDDEEDLFTAFAEDNAQVNAFTSFDRTSYLFSAI